MTPVLVARAAGGKVTKMAQHAPGDREYGSFALNETRRWTPRLTFHWQQWNRPGKDGRLGVSHDENEPRYM